MSVGKAIYARLNGDAAVSALVGTRIYPLKAPQGAALPRITYQVIFGSNVQTMDGPAGLGRYLVQVDCWAATFAAVDDLANKVKAKNVLDGFKGTAGTVVVQHCFRQDQRADFELSETSDDAGYFRVSLDFVLWIEE